MEDFLKYITISCFRYSKNRFNYWTWARNRKDSNAICTSGKDFAEADAQTKKEIRVARKRAVEEYVNKKIQLVSDKKKELQGNLDIFDGIDVEQAMLDIINNLQNTGHQLSEAVEKNSDLLHNIINLQNKASECDMLQNRYLL